MESAGWKKWGRQRQRRSPDRGTARIRREYALDEEGKLSWAPASPDPMPGRVSRTRMREMVADAEAFIAGHYAERLDLRSVPVPGWAWTNLLAHGSEEELASAALDVHAEPATWKEWRSARAYLASEVLRTVRDGTSLAEVQREALFPLELGLSKQPSMRTLSVQQWVATVRAALRTYEHSHPH